MEYIPIPLQLAPQTVQNIYLRKQLQFNNSDSDSESEDDGERTLFVANLPLDTTDDNIRDICKALGDVVLDKFQRQGTRHGLISLVDESAASRLLSKAKKLGESKKHRKVIAWEQYGPRGAEGYLARHHSKFPEEFELQEKVDEYMELFAEQEERDAEEAARAAEEVDEDGFRLVVYKNRKRLSDMAGPQSAVPEPKRKKKTLEKSDFYRFQLRENRKQEMSDLLKRYQEDKEKVEELKRRRMYRPF